VPAIAFCDADVRYPNRCAHLQRDAGVASQQSVFWRAARTKTQRLPKKLRTSFKKRDVIQKTDVVQNRDVIQKIATSFSRKRESVLTLLSDLQANGFPLARKCRQ